MIVIFFKKISKVLYSNQNVFIDIVNNSNNKKAEEAKRVRRDGKGGKGERL